jgi:membrane dipeptidase
LEDLHDFQEDKINVLISLEGASPIINDINNLYVFYKLGVRAMGLTWNHRNFVGDGIDTDYGLTPFGIEVIKEMERIGMIIDVSHLNIRGFYDVAKNTSKPFIASHSNSMSIHDHKRNLDDDQIVEIINRGGFIGMNFYTDFITNDKENGKKCLLKHIEHILKLGGDDVLGMGADFDGIDETPFPDAESYIEIESLLSSDLQLDPILIEKIMYKNLVDYTLKIL